MATINADVWNWVVSTLEGITPDDQRNRSDLFYYESGVLGLERRGPKHHRKFDLSVASADRAPSPHGPVAWTAETFQFPMSLGIIYVVDKSNAKRVNLQILDDATKIIRTLTNEANWLSIQGTAAGTMNSLSASFTGITGVSDEGLPINNTVIALFDLEVEVERASWS